MIRAILEYLGSWMVIVTPPPENHDPPEIGYATYDLFPHSPSDAPIYGDPEYSRNDSIQT